MRRRDIRLLWGCILFICTTVVFWTILPPQPNALYDQDDAAIAKDVEQDDLAALSRQSMKGVPPPGVDVVLSTPQPLLSSPESTARVHGGPGQLNSKGEMYYSNFEVDLIHVPKYTIVKGGSSAYLKEPKSNRLWPQPRDAEDRILPQINHIPVNPNIEEAEEEKLILIYNGYPSGIPDGRKKFEQDACPVQNCRMTEDKHKLTLADAVVFQGSLYSVPKAKRNPQQVWMYYVLEAPPNVGNLHQFDGHINWTASYRLDSTINTPYERFIPFANTTGNLPPPKRNFAAGKTDQVAWFVSNCYATNGRLQYAQELQKHISVHIYGECGPFRCFRSEHKKCTNLLNKKYKFYLAFENSNCQDYITEKLYSSGLQNDILPIVMGARPEDYAVVAPPNSYIHVDDFESAAHLAEYLHKLDRNDTLYNEYFRWKGTGEFIDTKYWCRLCSLVHEALNAAAKPEKKFSMWYSDVNKWWNDKDTCITVHGPIKWASWRNVNRTLVSDSKYLQYGPWPIS